MPENTTPPYNSYIDKIESIYTNHNVPAAILYFTSIFGRDKSFGQQEWGTGPLIIEEAGTIIEKKILEFDLSNQVIFSISFPQVTSVFAWQSPRLGKRESNLYKLGEYNTLDMSLKESSKNQEIFIGCPLELVILAQETKLWLNSSSVLGYYLALRYRHLQANLTEPNKILKK